MSLIYMALVSLAAGGALAAFAGPAAAIQCKDGFQLVQGNYLATPYCQDDLLAKVARQYGMRLSAAAIRENPNTKRHVCRFVGLDIRVLQTCIEVSPGLRGRGF